MSSASVTVTVGVKSKEQIVGRFLFYYSTPGQDRTVPDVGP